MAEMSIGSTEILHVYLSVHDKEILLAIKETIWKIEAVLILDWARLHITTVQKLYITNITVRTVQVRYYSSTSTVSTSRDFVCHSSAVLRNSQLFSCKSSCSITEMYSLTL